LKPILDSFPNIAPLRLYISFGAIFLLFLVDLSSIKSDFRTIMGRVPMPLRLLSYSALVVIIVLFGAYDNKSFIYFQF
jgi:hypothetical protein